MLILIKSKLTTNEVLHSVCAVTDIEELIGKIIENVNFDSI